MTKTFVKKPLILALALVSSVIQAQTLETDEVKVTATRVEKELLDVNMSVSVITSEQIAQSGAQTVADLLRDVPGVELSTDGSQGMKRIQIRGDNAFRTLIMIDGQRMTEQKSMSGTPILIDPSQIERIEVIKGPASVLYGADAIGGAVNIITKKGGSKPFEGTVSVGGNSSNRGGSASAQLFGQVGDWHYRVGAAYEGGRDLRTGAGKIDHTDFKSKAANAYLAYDITLDHTAGVTLDTFDLDFKSGARGYTSDQFYVQVPEWKRTKVGVFDEIRNVNDVLTKVRTDLFYQVSKKRMINHVAPPTPGMAVVNDNQADNELKQFGASIQADWMPTDRLYLITGYDVSYEKLDATSTSYTTVTMPRASMFYDKALTYRGELLTQALYASADYNLTDELTLNLGSRYTYVRTKMKQADGVSSNSHAPGVVTPVQQGTGTETDGHAVLNAGLIWRPNAEWSLRAAWSQGFRTPLLQERFIETTMGQSRSVLQGNPDLKPEKSDNFEVGARWVNGVVTLDTALFYNRARDYITTFVVNATTSRYDNVAKAETLGLELASSVRLGNTGFEPHLSMTLLRREFKQDGISTHDTGTPALYATYGLKWKGDTPWGLAYTNFFARSATESKSYNFGDKVTTTYGAWTTVNMTGGLDFGPEKRYSVNVGLYNLLDRDYYTSNSKFEPGRYVEAKFTARF